MYGGLVVYGAGYLPSSLSSSFIHSVQRNHSISFSPESWLKTFIYSLFAACTLNMSSALVPGFLCDNHACIPDKLTCDNANHCQDGEDEGLPHCQTSQRELSLSLSLSLSLCVSLSELFECLCVLSSEWHPLVWNGSPYEHFSLLVN